MFSGGEDLDFYHERMFNDILDNIKAEIREMEEDRDQCERLLEGVTSLTHQLREIVVSAQKGG